MELLPIFAANTSPSGTIQAETWAKIKRNVIDGLRQVMPLDGICLALHGAGVAENTGDIEGDLLRDLRLAFNVVAWNVSFDKANQVRDVLSFQCMPP